jgi:SPP1 gp7 family putative phage head morphogenesis protein
MPKLKVDPRLKMVTKNTVNNKLASRAVRQSTYLEQYKNGEVQKIVGLLNDGVIPDLLAEYQKRLYNITQRGYDTGPTTTLRLQQLIKATDGMLRGGVSAIKEQLNGDLNELALHQSDWQIAQITDSLPVKLDLLTPSPTLLKAIIDERPFDGHLMETWFNKLVEDTQHKLVQQIQIGLTRGDSVPDMVHRLQGVMDITRRNAAAIVRTATSHVVNQAREMTYEHNEDVIDQVQMVATLDDRTTEICMDMDGEVYPINEGPRPPFHYNCRTTTVPVVKSWKDLGIDLEEAPPGTRASMDGQVSDKLTYGDWLKGQSAELQNEALGPVRAQMFRDGEVDVHSFVNDQGKLLTLDELKGKL